MGVEPDAAREGPPDAEIEIPENLRVQLERLG
jgi:hypothetical protein